MGVEVVATPVMLQYPVGTAVTQTHQVKMEMNYALPGFKLDGQATQTTLAQISLANEQMEGQYVQPPFDVIFTVKNLRVDLKLNDHLISFLADDPGIFLDQIKAQRILDKPYRLRFDQNYDLDIKGGEFEKLLVDLNSLTSQELAGFLQDWFQHQFAFAGKELSIGTMVRKESTTRLPVSWTYEVTEITGEEIKADVRGHVESKNVKLLGEMQVDHQKQMESGMELILEGVGTGTITWNRENALNYHAQIDFLMTGVMKMGDYSWTMRFNIQQQLESR